MLLCQCTIVGSISLHQKIRMVTGEAGNELRKIRGFKVIIESYAETVADRRGVQSPDHLIIQCQKVPSIVEQRLPIRCDGQRSTPANEYPLAYPFLESLDLQAHRWLRQTQGAACGRKAAVLGHTSEATKQIYIYI
jgi:hypothetical protein